MEENEQPISPTQSEFETKTTNHQLNVNNKDFTIHWQNLVENFNSKDNKDKRHQFRNNHNPEERDKIVNKWKKNIIKVKINITFYY